MTTLTQRFYASATRVSSGVALAALVSYTVYDDAAGTSLADVATTSGGSVVPGSVVTATASGELEFFAEAGTKTLWFRCPAQAGFGVQEISAHPGARLDALESAALFAADLADLYPVPPTISGLVAWYAADTIAGLSNADPVVTWPDLSGYGRDAVQATGIRQPTYRTGVINSKPTVRFVVNTAGLATAAFSPAITQANTIVMVSYIATGAISADASWYDAAASGDRQVLYNGNTGHYKQWAGTDLVGPAITTGVHVICSVYNGGSSILRVDGTQVATGAAGAQGLGSLTIGNNQNFNGSLGGDLAELMVYDRALSATERQQLEWYLGLKWDVTVDSTGFDPTDSVPAPALVQAVPATATTIAVTEPLTQSILDRHAVNREALHLRSGTHYVPVALSVPAAVPILGESTDWNGGGGTFIQGVSGVDVFVLEAATGEGYTFRDLKISGGRRQISSSATSYHTFMHIENCKFIDPDAECIYLATGHERFRLVQCLLEGGTYGLRIVNTAGGLGAYFDKSTLDGAYIGGQSINNVKIECELVNSILFNQVTFNTAGGHSVYIDGGCRALQFNCCNTEGGGQDGKNNRTTGSISSGSPTLTVASGTGLANSDPITVAGAGTSGRDLTTTISSGGGTTTLTLAANAATTVAGAVVTNASYDDIFVASSIAESSELLFAGCAFGGEGTGGHLRYVLNWPYDFGHATFIGGGGGIAQVPIYDPYSRVRMVADRHALRRPSFTHTIGEDIWPKAPAPTVTGSRGGNAALASLLTKLAERGLIIDGSS